MRVPLDEHFDLALHGFEGMRQSGSAQRCRILFSRVPHSHLVVILTAAAASVKQTRILFIISVGPHILCKEVDKMERSDRKQKTGRDGQILSILAKSVRRIIQEDAGGLEGLQEIRLRTGQPVRIVRGNREKILPSESDPHIITKEEVRETMDYISHYSLYAYENELRQGFLTIEGRAQSGSGGQSDHGAG